MLLETLEGLRDHGAEVFLALPVAGPLVEEAEARGATVTLCPSPVLRKSFLNPRGVLTLAGQALLSAVASGSLVRRVRPDVIYVNTITIPLWPLVASAARLPSLIHVHEAEGDAPAVVRRAMALPLFLGTTLVANSHFSTRVLGSVFPRLAAKARVISNGVVAPHDAPPARRVLEGPLRLAYVGRLSHRKGVDLVLEAAEILLERGVQVEVDLVGSVYPGNEGYEQMLRERAASGKLEGRVTFLGFQPSVWAALAAADVVVIPSRADEPFGNTAVEAVLAKRPAVVSRTSGLIEASSGFESTVQVTPDSADAIADAVEQIARRWDFFRARAIDDAVLATDRNSIEAYRRNISSAVLDLADRKRHV